MLLLELLKNSLDLTYVFQGALNSINSCVSEENSLKFHICNQPWGGEDFQG